MSNNLIEGVESSIRSLTQRVFSLVNQSVLFVDEQFAEWFNLTIGIDCLVKQGALQCLREFHSFQTGGQHPKGAFLISQPIREMQMEVLKSIITSSQFETVTIITHLHPEDFGEREDYYEHVKEACLSWMVNDSSKCEIVLEKFPVALLPSKFNRSNTKFFFNPLCCWSDEPRNFKQIINLGTYKQLLDFDSQSNPPPNRSFKELLDDNEKQDFESSIGSLNAILTQLDVQEDCFSVGVLSKFVASELSKSNDAKRRRKVAKGKLSLLLIDRNLDLASVALFHEETVFDKIMNILPELSPLSSDVQIDLRGYLFEQSFSRCLPGNFFHYTDDSCVFLIDKFLTSKPKECLLDVYRKLTDVIPASDNENKIAKINSETLKNKLKSGYKKNAKKVLEEIDLIQIISAYCQISDLKAKQAYLYDKLTSYVKVFTQGLLEDQDQSILNRLCSQFEASDKADGFTTKQLMTIMVYVFSLADHQTLDNPIDEQKLKSLLVRRLIEDGQSHRSEPECIQKLVKGNDHSTFVENFFANLKLLGGLRSNLKKFNHLLERDEERSVSSFKPLLKSLLDDLMDSKVSMALDDRSKSAEMVDIEYHSGSSNSSEGLRDLFKSFTFGYSKTNTDKAHPLNNDTLLVYFVGGITSHEFKMAKQAFKDTNYNVLIGSSHFHSHAKMLSYLVV